MIKFKSFEDVCKLSKGQTFDYLVDDYIYNKDTKLLSVAPQKRDIYEEINSYSNTSLDAILDKYSSICQVDPNLIIQERKEADLADIGEAFEKAEAYRSRCGLSSELSYKQIYDLMLKEAQDLDKKLKGGVNNAKKTSSNEESIEKVIHENSEKSSQEKSS